MIVLTCRADRIIIELPSGNELFLDYCGEGEADRVMVHSRDSGEGDSPAALDLVVPDPDTVCAVDDDGRRVCEIHRVHVRHHGPTDDGRAEVPPEFVEGWDSVDE